MWVIDLIHSILNNCTEDDAVAFLELLYEV